MRLAPEVVVRLRRDADLDHCEAALRAVHEADGYPMNWPADPNGWLTPPGPDGEPVALRPYG